MRKCRSSKSFAKVRCICGVDICFYKNYPAICNYCGRRVYPTKECEFKEKMKKEIKK